MDGADTIARVGDDYGISISADELRSGYVVLDVDAMQPGDLTPPRLVVRRVIHAPMLVAVSFEGERSRHLPRWHYYLRTHEFVVEREPFEF